MAIEGPLRELGIHDVFQLLDLSRKTGTLLVRSTLRDNEGTIFFGSGRVVYASIRSNPNPLGELLLRAGKLGEADLERAITLQRERHASQLLGEILVEIGAISSRELERQMRFQVEEVVFELLSWNEGFFSFEEGVFDDLVPEARVSISTESLLMEGARRIDEWSRIATRIPDLDLVPTLADIPEDRPVQLDLLPNEWEVLSLVDSERSVRTMARALGRSDFEVARVLYGLISTGVVTVPATNGAQSAEAAALAVGDGIIMHKDDVARSLARARQLSRDGNGPEAVDAIKLLLRAEPESPELHLELGYAALNMAMAAQAASSWRRFLDLNPGGAPGEAARSLIAQLEQLTIAVQRHYRE
jgi:hypothetical protein